jgi:hypothetical protein
MCGPNCTDCNNSPAPAMVAGSSTQAKSQPQPAGQPAAPQAVVQAAGQPGMMRTSGNSSGLGRDIITAASNAPPVSPGVLGTALATTNSELKKLSSPIYALPKQVPGLGYVLYLSGLTESQVIEVTLLTQNTNLSYNTVLLDIGFYTNIQGNANYINRIFTKDISLSLATNNKANAFNVGNDNYTPLQTSYYSEYPYFLDAIQTVLSNENLEQPTYGIVKYFDVVIGAAKN